MKINISLDKKSIQNAIKQINAVKKKMAKKLPTVYLQKCVASIIDIANRNLSLTNIGSDVQSLIQTSWIISDVVGNKITLSNNAEYESGKNLAVFVEFGVGIVGQGSSHKLASQVGYEYNVLSDAKDQFGNWIYSLDGGVGTMNIESNYYEMSNDGLWIKTKGSPSTMFLYKAWKEFETSGLYKQLWEQAKAEVIG